MPSARTGLIDFYLLFHVSQLKFTLFGKISTSGLKPDRQWDVHSGSMRYRKLIQPIDLIILTVGHVCVCLQRIVLCHGITLHMHLKCYHYATSVSLGSHLSHVSAYDFRWN